MARRQRLRCEAHSLHCQEMESGKLRKADPKLAPEQFKHLDLGELSRKSLLGLVTPGKDQIERRHSLPSMSFYRL